MQSRTELAYCSEATSIALASTLCKNSSSACESVLVWKVSLMKAAVVKAISLDFLSKAQGLKKEPLCKIAPRNRSIIVCKYNRVICF
jgi:hypothetical protein